AALQRADAVLLVARPDYTSLRHTRRVLDRLDRAGVPQSRVRLVVNRHGQAQELPADEVRSALAIEHLHLIPDDAGTVNGANNTAVPVVLRAPTSKVAQPIRRLAKVLCPAGAAAAPSAPAASRNPLRWLMPFR